MQNMTAAQLAQAIENARFAASEASARAQRETEPASIARFTMNAAAARSELQSLEAAQAKANAVQVKAAKVEAKPVKARCQCYAQIKEFFAVARENGLDAQNKAGCRAAVGMLLGRKIETRADLNGSEWAFCTNALRMGRLFW